MSGHRERTASRPQRHSEPKVSERRVIHVVTSRTFKGSGRGAGGGTICRQGRRWSRTGTCQANGLNISPGQRCVAVKQPSKAFSAFPPRAPLRPPGAHRAQAHQREADALERDLLVGAALPHLNRAADLRVEHQARHHFGPGVLFSMGWRVMRSTTARVRESARWRGSPSGGGQLLPDAGSRTEAFVMPGLAQHLVLHGLQGAELPQHEKEPTFLADPEEVQARTGVDNRPKGRSFSFAASPGVPMSSSGALRASSKASRSTSPSEFRWSHSIRPAAPRSLRQRGVRHRPPGFPRRKICPYPHLRSRG
ncbi:hypothetical protein NORO109296_04215 [Nocardiopsis rhodophaea]